MPVFIIFNSATGAIQGSVAITNPDPDILAALVAANTPADSSMLAVDPGHDAVNNQSGWRVVDGALSEIVPSDAELVAAAKVAQSAAMDVAYQTQIDNGFTSAALGSSYLYPGTAVDQANLTAVVTASMIPTQPADWTTLFWCAPADTPAVWNYLPHTAAQIHQVGIDALAYIMGTKMQRATRNAQIQAAATVAAVEAVVW